MYRTKYEVIFNPYNFAQVRASLSWFYEDGFAPSNYWLSMPEMDVLIASKYGRVLYVSNNIRSFTVVTSLVCIWTEHWTKHSHIAIGFVNGNHYVRINLGTQCLLFLHNGYIWGICVQLDGQPRINLLKRYVD